MAEVPQIQPEEGLRPSDKISDRFAWAPGSYAQPGIPTDQELLTSYWPKMEPEAPAMRGIAPPPAAPEQPPGAPMQPPPEAPGMPPGGMPAPAAQPTPTPGPNLPEYRYITPPPAEQYKGLVGAMKGPGQAALIFTALLGGLAARNGATGVMQAFTGLSEGFQQGNKDRIERERQIWSDQMDATIKNNRVEYDKYNSALMNPRLSAENKLGELHTMAVANGNTALASAIRSGNIPLVYSYINQMKDVGDKLSKTKLAALGLTEEALNDAAYKYYKTGKLPPYMRDQRQRDAIMNRAAELREAEGKDPREIPLDQQEFLARSAGMRTLETRAANLQLAASEAETLIPRVRETSAKVSRTDYPTLNSVIIAAQRGTGGEDVIKLGIAANSLLYVYARVLKPTGVLNEADVKRAQDILNIAWSQGQVNAALDQMKVELQAAEEGLGIARDRYKRGGAVAPSAPAPPAGGVIPEGWSVRER